MQSPSVAAAIGNIGIAAQLAGSVVLASFFALLRRNSRRRPYFRAWSWAWVALAAAIGALFVKFLVLPPLLGPGAESLVVRRVTEWVYQFGKLCFAGLLTLGVMRFVRGAPRVTLIRQVTLLAAVYATVSIALTPNLARLVVWQVPVVTVAYAYCALALALLPRSRRTLGVRAAAVGFAGMAMLWATYSVAFLRPVEAGVLGAVATYNSFIDLLLHVVLGLGMVILLMEDAKREVDDANAELAAAHRRLRSASLYDALTGSLNRTAFNEGVGLEVARSTFGAVVMLDLDNLKVVNDTHGHAAGDQLLAALVHALRAALRPTDRVYRWGGDEFLVVMPGARAAQVRHRLDEILAKAEPVTVNDWTPPIPVLVSLGSADYYAAERMPQAIERADEAMYEEKNRRRARQALGAPSPVAARAD